MGSVNRCRVLETDKAIKTQHQLQGVPEKMTIVQKCATGFAAVLLSSAALLDAASADPSMVASAGSVQRFDHSQIKEVAPSNTADLTY